MTAADDRAAYIKGLRMLAAVLAQNDDIPLPYHGSDTPLNIMFLGDPDARAKMAAAARAFPVTWRKDTLDGDRVSYFQLHGPLGGLQIELSAFRDAVCTRVVTGTEDREVEEIVRPAETRTVVRPVEVVTWECGSLLAPASCPECGGVAPGHQLTCPRIPAGPEHDAGSEAAGE